MTSKKDTTASANYATQKIYLVPPENLSITGIDYAVGDEKAPHYDARIKFPIREAIVKNMMVRGVSDPVHVIKDGDMWVVISGRQRVRTAREANKRLEAEGSPLLKVQVILTHGDAKEAFGLNLSSNELRQNDDVLGKSYKIQQALDYGMSWEEVSFYMGLSVFRLKNIRKLLDLSPEVKDEIRKGTLSAQAALELVKLSPEEQKKVVDELAAEADAADQEEEESSEDAPAKKAKKQKSGKLPKVSTSAVKKKVTGEVHMKTRKVIEDRLKHLEETKGNQHAIWALKWVLGQAE